MNRHHAHGLRFAAATAALLALALLAGCGSGSGHSGVHAVRVARAAKVAHEAPDPLAAQSYPDPTGARQHAKAAAPTAVAASLVSPGAPSTAQVAAQLAQEKRLLQRRAVRSQIGTIAADSGTFTPNNALPTQILQVIAGGNAIADFPYLYGGGHGSFVDSAYDCSGSVSYALAAAGLIASPETSGQLEHWGAPGYGRYLTVFANAGHTFMLVDGVWFDTAGRAGPYSTRWLTSKPSLVGYVVRHYPGL
jgi:hypothetical protein